MADHSELSPDVDPDLTIIVRAQQAVDRWRRATRPDAFERVLERTLHQPWDPFLMSEERRETVRRVAEAIPEGRGHAFRNRAPLLAIARQSRQRQS
jgi:hypothetical protein